MLRIALPSMPACSSAVPLSPYLHKQSFSALVPSCRRCHGSMSKMGGEASYLANTTKAAIEVTEMPGMQVIMRRIREEVAGSNECEVTRRPTS